MLIVHYQDTCLSDPHNPLPIPHEWESEKDIVNLPMVVLPLFLLLLRIVLSSVNGDWQQIHSHILSLRKAYKLEEGKNVGDHLNQG